MAIRDDLFQPGHYSSIPKWLLKASNVAPAAKLVWMAIFDRLGKNEAAWPGVAQIVVDTGLSRRGVQLAITQLESLGVIEIIYRSGESNRYRPVEYPKAIRSLKQRIR